MKYLVWDFDGTLGFRDGMWSGTFLEILDREMPGHDVRLDQIRPFAQKGFPWHAPETPHDFIRTADEWWSFLLPVIEQGFQCGARLDSQKAQLLARQFRHVYLDLSRWQLYKDSVPCLRALSSMGWKHYILSNHVPELKILLDALGLSPFIEQIFNSAETGFEKPHPRAFANVLAATPLRERIVMIGDNFAADVLGARAAGMEAILVRNTPPDKSLACTSLAELPQYL